MSLYESFSNNLKMNTSHKKSTKRSKELGYKLLESELTTRTNAQGAPEVRYSGPLTGSGLSKHVEAVFTPDCLKVYNEEWGFIMVFGEIDTDSMENMSQYWFYNDYENNEEFRARIDKAATALYRKMKKAFDAEIYKDETVKESEDLANKYAYLGHVLNFLNNTAPGGISDGEIRVLADAMYNIDTGKGELPRTEGTFKVTPEQRDEVTTAIETDNLQRFLGVLNNIVVDNSTEIVQEAAGPDVPAYLGDPNDDPDWHPESKRAEKPEPEVTNFKEKNRPEPTGEVVTSQDLNYPGVAFKAIDGDETLYVTAWWSDNEPFSDEEEKLEWEDPDDVWDINYNIYDTEGNEIDGGLLLTYDYGKWSASELCNDMLGLSGHTNEHKVSLVPTDEVEGLLEESQTQEIEGIISDMVKKNPNAEKYLDEYYAYIDTLEPAKDLNKDSGEFNPEWEDWYKNTSNVLYSPTAWNKFIAWVKEKYGEDAVKGLNESDSLKTFKFKVYTESNVANGKASRLADTVDTLKEAEDLIQSYRKQNLKAHYKVNKD